MTAPRRWAATSWLLLLLLPLGAASADASKIRLLASTTSPALGEEFALILEVTHPVLPRRPGQLRWPDLDHFARLGDTSSALYPLAGDRSEGWVETVTLHLLPLQPGPVILDGGRVEVAESDRPIPPLRLAVRDLPLTGQPADFSGFVGELRADLAVLSGEEGMDELRLTLSGRGPLRKLSLPPFDRAPGVHLEQIADRHRRLADGRQQREATYRRRHLIPLVDRVDFRLSYFDPKSERYRKLELGAGNSGRAILLLLPLGLLGAGCTLFLVRARRARLRSVEDLLAALLDEPVAHFSRHQIERRLAARRPELVELLRTYWRADDTRFMPPGNRFAPDLADPERELVRRLRKAIDKRGPLPALSGLVKPARGSS